MNVNDITVRGARLADSTEISRLLTELGYPTSSKEAGNRLATLLGNDRHYIAVAEARTGDLMGWVHVEHRSSLEIGERAELMGLVVDATGRRTGLGRLLVDEAERWARAQGLRQVIVRSNVARDLSHPFYSAVGYSRTKTQHVYGRTLPTEDQSETPRVSPDSLSPEALRMRINAYPPYVGAGIEVTHLAEDFGEIRVQMRLTNQNRNLVGTHFGGSLYAMVDPHHMILLMRRLGPGYTLWDKSAAIEFVKPGRGAVRATIRVTDEDIAAISTATASGQKHHPRWTVDVQDQEGDVVARIVKTLFVRKEDPAA